MIVHYYGELNEPADEIAAHFEKVDDLIGTMGRSAYRNGENLHAEIGPAGSPVAKIVTLDVGDIEKRGDTYVFPIAWWATGASRLFPRMEGEITVAPIGDKRSRISFQGNYEPPLGALGRLLDRSLLGRVADSTVKDWIDRLMASAGEGLNRPG